VTKSADRLDADARLVQRTARSVGLWITVAVSALVIAVLIAVLAFVFRQVPINDLLDKHHHEETVDVGGLDALIAAVMIGVIAIALAGAIGLFATRRVVAPLVDALSRQRRFVADASHELRTPLAILDTRLQALERSMALDDPHRETVHELRGDSRTLIAIVGDLLESVEVENTAPRGPVAVGRVVEAAVDAMGMLAQERGVRVASAPVSDDLAVAMPETSLHRALVALIDNAIKHSPEGQTVTVTTTASRSEVRIAVSDHGSGIQGIDPDRVFDRFARSSRSADGGGSARTGFGIGLSLVQDTAGRFGGAVEVTETSKRGATITMRLPRVRS
jgi:signal transduction histidine kinase